MSNIGEKKEKDRVITKFQVRKVAAVFFSVRGTVRTDERPVLRTAAELRVSSGSAEGVLESY